MEKIASFTIDHLRLLRGVYVSRKDRLGAEVATTFDIRLKAPNREPPLSPEALHTIEHLGATFLRSHPAWKDRIVYFGPMGCLTGCYLVVHGDFSSRDVLPLVTEAFAFMADFQGAIPGATPAECGNWSFHDLAGARREAAVFLHEVLEQATDANLAYPD